MRVGVSGGPGIGKTTLTATLAAALNLPVVSEGVREWLKANSLEAPHAGPLGRRIELQKYFLARKITLECQTKSFVSDRTVVDGIVIVKQRFPGLHKDRRLLMLLEKAALHATTGYDVIVVPPLNVFGDTDPIRYMDIGSRRREHAAILCYLRHHKICRLLLRGSSIEDWVSEIRRALLG